MRLTQRASNLQHPEPPASAANTPSDPRYLSVLTLRVHRRPPSLPGTFTAGGASLISAEATEVTPGQGPGRSSWLRLIEVAANHVRGADSTLRAAAHAPNKVPSYSMHACSHPVSPFTFLPA